MTCLHYWISRLKHRGMKRLNWITDTSRNKHQGTMHKIYKWIHFEVTNTSIDMVEEVVQTPHVSQPVTTPSTPMTPWHGSTQGPSTQVVAQDTLTSTPRGQNTSSSISSSWYIEFILSLCIIFSYILSTNIWISCWRGRNIITACAQLCLKLMVAFDTLYYLEKSRIIT